MTPCAHLVTFFWPFFYVGAGLIGNRCCTDCGARFETKIIVAGIEHEYR